MGDRSVITARSISYENRGSAQARRPVDAENLSRLIDARLRVYVARNFLCMCVEAAMSRGIDGVMLRWRDAENMALREVCCGLASSYEEMRREMPEMLMRMVAALLVDY